jgi:hypothetical protein
MLGFHTVEAAEAWIAQDKRLAAAAHEAAQPAIDTQPAREA